MPLHHALPDRIDEIRACDGTSSDGPERKAAQFGNRHGEIANMWRLILTDANNDLRGMHGHIALVPEIAVRAHHGCAEAKELFRSNLDHQHIHQKQNPVLVVGRNLRHQPAHFRARETLWHNGVRIGMLAEQHVTHGKPHLVVAAFAAREIAAFVEAVRDQQALVQMPRRGLRDVIDNDVLKVRPPRFDHAGDA